MVTSWKSKSGCASKRSGRLLRITYGKVDYISIQETNNPTYIVDRNSSEKVNMEHQRMHMKFLHSTKINFFRKYQK
jgi:hypothetical protein